MISFSGCEKDAVSPAPSSEESSNPEKINGLYFKELAISDETGKNTVFYKLSATKKETIDAYLKNNSLSIEVNKKALPVAFLPNLNSKIDEQALKSDNETATEEELNDNTVSIEKLRMNIEDDVTGINLIITSKGLKSDAFLDHSYKTDSHYLCCVC